MGNAPTYVWNEQAGTCLGANLPLSYSSNVSGFKSQQTAYYYDETHQIGLGRGDKELFKAYCRFYCYFDDRCTAYEVNLPNELSMLITTAEVLMELSGQEGEVEYAYDGQATCTMYQDMTHTAQRIPCDPYNVQWSHEAQDFVQLIPCPESGYNTYGSDYTEYGDHGGCEGHGNYLINGSCEGLNFRNRNADGYHKKTCTTKRPDDRRRNLPVGDDLASEAEAILRSGVLPEDISAVVNGLDLDHATLAAALRRFGSGRSSGPEVELVSEHRRNEQSELRDRLLAQGDLRDK